MSDRLNNIRVVDPVLTQLAWGYMNPTFVADKLFPTVKVEKEAGKFPIFGKEAFKAYNTLRAIRGGSNVLVPENITTGTYVLAENDIGYPIDYREDADAMFNLQQWATKAAQDIIALGKEVDAATLATTTGNFGSNTVTLTGNDQWDVVHADSLPIADITTGKEAIRAGIGMYPNVMIVSATAYASLATHSTILERVKYTSLGVVTPQVLAAILDIPNVYVAGAIKSTDAGVFSDVWGDDCILAYVPGAVGGVNSMYQPGFGYAFQKNGNPQVDTYFAEGGKIQIVRSTDIYDVQISAAAAGYLIHDAV